MLFDKIRKFKVWRRVAAAVGCMALTVCAALPALAAEGDPAGSGVVVDYGSITQQAQSSFTGIFSSATPMILAILGAGVGIMAIYLIWGFAKRAVGKATSSRG